LKPQGRGENSLLRAVRAAGFREKTTSKKRLADRARTFRKSGLDVQKHTLHPAAGKFFFLTSPFICQRRDATGPLSRTSLGWTARARRRVMEGEDSKPAR